MFAILVEENDTKKTLEFEKTLKCIPYMTLDKRQE